MTGLRPGTTGVYDNGQDWSQDAPRQDADHAVPQGGLQRLRRRQDLPRQRPPRRRMDRLPASSRRRKARRTRARRTTASAASSSSRSPTTRSSPTKAPSTTASSTSGRSRRSRSSSPSGCTSRTCRGTCRRSTTTCSRSIRSHCHRTRKGTSSDVPAGGLKMAKADGDHAAMLKSGRWKEAVQGYLAAIAYCDAQSRPAARRLRQEPAQRQHHHLLLGRPRLAPRREGALAEVRVVGGVGPHAVSSGSCRG